MSRMGKKPIVIGDKVKVEISGSKVSVSGPKGSHTLDIPEHISCSFTDDKKELIVARDNEERQTRMNHGLIRSLLNSMVVGVDKGFTIQLEFFGVGYRAQLQGQTLTMSLGYSKPRIYTVPANVKVSMPDPTHITLESHDKQAVGQVAADIRANRVPDAYHGKGVRFVGEQLSLKEGKKV